MNYYVYTLVNPLTNLPFYVGMGQNNRAWSHLQNWDNTNVYKSRTIAKIRNSGFEPEVTIIKTGLTKLEAGLLESELITTYKKKNDGGMQQISQTVGLAVIIPNFLLRNQERRFLT